MLTLWLVVGGCAGKNNAQKQDSISQRGKEKIAFTSDRDGSDEIYVMNPDGSNETRLTTNDAVDRQPTFRPQG
jgi:TolB protein